MVISLFLPLCLYRGWLGHYVAVPLLEKRNNYERELEVPTVAASALESRVISGETRGVYFPLKPQAMGESLVTEKRINSLVFFLSLSRHRSVPLAGST